MKGALSTLSFGTFSPYPPPQRGQSSVRSLPQMAAHWQLQGPSDPFFREGSSLSGLA